MTCDLDSSQQNISQSGRQEMIMKDCVQCNLLMVGKISTSRGA